MNIIKVKFYEIYHQVLKLVNPELFPVIFHCEISNVLQKGKNARRNERGSIETCILFIFKAL